MLSHKPDWPDRLAAATTDLPGRNGWEYERPCNAWMIAQATAVRRMA